MLRNRRWSAYVLNAVIGAGIATGHAPLGLWWLSCAGLIVGLHRFGRNSGSGFGFGWWIGVGYFAVALHWIVEPFLVDVSRHGWMAPFALVFLSGGLALFWGAAFWLASRIGKKVWTVALTLTLAEFARATILTGFPWAMLAYIWVDTPFSQIAAFVGPHGLTAVTLLLGSALVWAWHIRRPLVALPLLASAALWGAGIARVPAETDQTGLTVRLIQPNAQQREKWHPDFVQTFFDRQLDFTSAPGNVDLIVWPEVAVPYLAGRRPDLDKVIATAAGNDKPVVLGIRRLEETGAGRNWFNSLIVLDGDGEVIQEYAKHHLVPFGEYLPFPGLFDAIGLEALAANAGQFSAGPGPGSLSVADVPPFQALICYEAIFPAEILGGKDRPDWLLHITNDAWFGTFSGPFQHLDQARFRSIESGTPLARSANTGVSAMIDPYGRVLDQLPLNTAGYLDVALPKPIGQTVYSRYGDAPLLAFVAVLLVFVVALSRLVTDRKPINR